VAYQPAYLDDLRRRVALSVVIGQRVRLQRRGREYVGLCPFHREQTPSFYVVEDKGFFHCFGCGAHGDAIAFLMRADNLDFPEAVAKLADGQGAADAAAPAVGAAVVRHDKTARHRRIAWHLWQDAGPIRGTPAEKYLRGRGLSPPPAPVLRFMARCWNRETGRQLPAILARVDDADGNFVAVHRTWLCADGSGKADLRDPKMSLGSRRGGAIRLAAAASLLAIAEGIEDALSVIVAAGIPAWSAVSKSGFGSLQLPAEVREVLIVADHDGNGSGELAARRAGERWAGEGRRVRLWLSPRVGEDANNLLLKGEKGDVTRGPREGARPD
jgi:DNA primase